MCGHRMQLPPGEEERPRQQREPADDGGGRGYDEASRWHVAGRVHLCEPAVGPATYGRSCTELKDAFIMTNVVGPFTLHALYLLRISALSISSWPTVDPV